MSVPSAPSSGASPVARAVSLYASSVPSSGDATLVERRAGYDRMLQSFRIPDGVEVRAWREDGLDGYTVDATGGTSQRVAVMFHGGGYILGSAAGYRAHAAYVSRAADCVVLLPEYRLAPEHPYPAAVEDAVTVVRKAFTMADPDSTFLIGDSAGGGLALGCLLALRDLDLPRPAAVALISPLVDLRADNPSYTHNADVDRMVSRASIRRVAQLYLEGADPAEAPWADAMTADLSSLPPSLIMTGTHEVLLDDSRLLVQRLEQAGVAHRYTEFEKMIHVWTVFAEILSEASVAFGHLSDFVDRHVGGGRPGRRPAFDATAFQAWIGVSEGADRA